MVLWLKYFSGVVVGAVGRVCNEVNTHVDSSRAGYMRELLCFYELYAFMWFSLNLF